MTTRDESTQDAGVELLYIEPVDPAKGYLGNAQIAHDFVHAFAREVMLSFDSYLHATEKPSVVNANITAIVKRYGDALMGRDPAYAIAPWQGRRLAGKLLAAIPAMKGDDDPGEAFFNHIALQCINCAAAMAKGMDEAAAGAKLGEILDDWIRLMLGLK